MKTRSLSTRTTNEEVQGPPRILALPPFSAYNLAQTSLSASHGVDTIQNLRKLSGPFDTSGRFCHCSGGRG